MHGRRIGKNIVNLDHPGDVRFITCAWDTCEARGVDLHRAHFHDHNPGYPCEASGAKHVIYVFCSERHKQYFAHSHHRMGYLPPGSRTLMS